MAKVQDIGHSLSLTCTCTNFFHPGHYFRLVNDTQYYYMNSLCCNEESITLFSYPTYLKTIVIIQKTYVDIKFSAHEAFLE